MKKESIFNGYDSIFATRLRKLMDEHKRTQKEVADVLGITRQAISQYLDGAVQPNVEKLYKLSDYFQVSCDWLVGKSDTKSSDIDDVAINKKLGLTQEAIEHLVFLVEDNKEIESLENDLKTINFLLSDDENSRTGLLSNIAEYLYGTEIMEMCKNAHYHIDSVISIESGKETDLGAHIISNFLGEADILNMLLLKTQTSLVKSMEYTRNIDFAKSRSFGGYDMKKDEK